MRRLSVSDAVSCAKQFGQPYMVCEMDHEDGRRKYVRSLEYSNDDEFLAFDGKILAIGYPDGTRE
jgi:hypothetical protein